VRGYGPRRRRDGRSHCRCKSVRPVLLPGQVSKNKRSHQDEMVAFCVWSRSNLWDNLGRGGVRRQSRADQLCDSVSAKPFAILRRVNTDGVSTDQLWRLWYCFRALVDVRPLQVRSVDVSGHLGHRQVPAIMVCSGWFPVLCGNARPWLCRKRRLWHRDHSPVARLSQLSHSGRAPNANIGDRDRS
jgi:hypothetical protein